MSLFERLDKSMPRLENWSLFEYEDKAVVMGVVHNHYKILEGTHIRTSLVRSIEIVEDIKTILFTKNSMYLLGKENSSVENRQILMEYHTLFCVKRGISA